jgi:SM-20-related protein
MPDFLEFEAFLAPGAVAELVDELSAASGSAATVLSGNPGGVVHGARKSTKVAVPDATRARVKQLLMDAKPKLEEAFGVELGEIEDPQFLRYDVGDYFVPHQDGNTPALHDDSRFRRVSGVIFLSPRSDEPRDDAYSGGELRFHGHYSEPHPPESAQGTPGSLVAFKSEITHEVTMVTNGVRYSVAAFFRARS